MKSHIIPVAAVRRLAGRLLSCLLLAALAGPFWPAPASLAQTTFQDPVFGPLLNLARSHHSATLLPDGSVLVAGGEGNAGVLDSVERLDPRQGSWSPAAALPVRRMNHTATLMPDGRVWVVGGVVGVDPDGVPARGTVIYEPTADAWGRGPNLVHGRHLHTTTGLKDGSLLVVGGFDADGQALGAERFDPSLGSWVDAGRMQLPRAGHTATRLADGSVLVVGGVRSGSSSSEAVQEAERFVPDSGAWLPAGSLPAGPVLHSATLLPDGRVLVVGGRDAGPSEFLYDPGTNDWQPAASAGVAHTAHTANLSPSGEVVVVGNGQPIERYNPEKGQWLEWAVRNATGMSLSRRHHTATWLPNGGLLVVGGEDARQKLATTLLLPAAVGTRVDGPRLLEARAKHTATLLEDGRVLVVAGLGSRPGAPGSAYRLLASAELYLPGPSDAVGSWQPAAALPEGRVGHSATRLEDGQVLVAGGIGELSQTSSKAWRYDPVHDAWAAAAAMQVDRTEHTATLLEDGRVLVVGGHLSPENAPTGTTEIYDPATDRWQAAAKLPEPRSEHAAIRLADGKVLVAGGWHVLAGTVEALASAWVYDPAADTWTQTAPLSAPRFRHVAVGLASGDVLVGGGSPDDPNGLPIERFDLPNQRWQTLGRLHFPAPTLIPLPTGGILVNDRQVWDAASGNSALVPGSDTPINLWEHSATRLLSGAVLVAGGTYSAVSDALHTLPESRVKVVRPGALAWTGSGPSLSRVPPVAMIGRPLEFQATGLWSTSEASGGNGARNSAGDLPLVTMESLATGQIQTVWPQALTTNFADTYASRPLLGLSPGLARLTVTSGGQTGQSALLQLLPNRVCPTLVLTPTVLPVGVVGRPYGPVVLRAEAGVEPIQFTITADPIPGLRIKGQSLAGLPEVAGEFRMQVVVRDAVGCGGQGSLAVTFLGLSDFPWSAAGATQAARTQHTATLLPNGEVLAVGGMGGSGGPGGPLASVERFSPGSGQWASDPPLPGVRRLHVAVPLPGGEVLVAGGFGQAAFALDSALVYHPPTHTWRPTGFLRAPRARMSATVLLDGRVLVAGGVGADLLAMSSAELYDPVTGMWQPAAAMSVPRVGHTATRLADGRVLVLGRAGASSEVDEAELYDPARNVWQRVGGPIPSRQYHTALLLEDGRVLVAGGWGTNGTLRRADLFDPAAGRWLPAPDLLHARADHAAVLLPSGDALIVGGGPTERWDAAAGKWSFLVPEDQAAFEPEAARTGPTATLLDGGRVLVMGGSDTSLIYHFGVGRWLQAGNLASGRNGHTATPLPDGRVLIAGGFRSAGQPLDKSLALSTCEVFDPHTGTWSAAAELAVGRAQHTATLLPSGAVFLAGGRPARNGDAMGSLALLLPGSTTWRLAGTLGERRAGHTATLLQDGTVLVAGGWQDNSELNGLASAELCTPLASRCVPTGNLNTPRTGHTATLLPDGRVLIAGGVSVRGNLESSAELYDPRTGKWTPTGGLLSPRTLHAATLLANGDVLVTGGPRLAGTPLGMRWVERYSTATGTWLATMPLDADHLGHTATLLPSGEVLVLGAQVEGNQSLTNADLFDPATETWHQAPSFYVTRGFHTATLLQDGRVLIAGGESGLRRTEIYDPDPAVPLDRRPILRSLSGSAQHVLADTVLAGTVLTNTLRITGDRLRSVSEGSGGNGSQHSATDGPRLQLRAMEGERTDWLLPLPPADDSERTRLEFELPNFPPGWALLTPFSRGVAGPSVPVLVARQNGCGPMQLTPSELPTATVRFAYPTPLVELTGGDPPYTFQWTGALPAGLTAAGSRLQGTPQVSGSFQLRLTALDARWCAVTRDFTLAVLADPTHRQLYLPRVVRTGSPLERMRRITTGDAGGWQPAVSPNGRLLAYVPANGRPELMLRDLLDPLGDQVMVAAATGALTGTLESPTFLPDGQEVVFGRVVLARGWGIWRVNLGGVLTQNSNTAVREPRHPSVGTANGRLTIAVDGLDGDQNANIFIGPWPYGIQRATIDRAHDKFPSLSPDAGQVLFRSERDGNSEIYRMGVSGEEPVRLTNDPAYDGYATFSPDASRILFQSQRDGRDAVYVMDTDGRNLRLLTPGPHRYVTPRFLPDGCGIVLASDQADPGGRLDVYVWEGAVCGG